MTLPFSTVPLSVVILTKNEEKRLADCLESVRWADEILVVDDESTDRTVEVAQAHQARVLHRKMEIEGRHRNWAYAQARHDWVFSLDADERITPELAREIQQLFRSAPSHDVYTVPRRNYLGRRWIRHGGWYPSRQVKLFKRSVFRWEETTVHPRAISDRPSAHLSGDLIHFSYRDLTDFVQKLNRQTTLEAEKWVQDGRKMPAGKALWRAVDRFWRAYIGKKGHRDGTLGFIAAGLGGAYQLISYAKYFSATRRQTLMPQIETPAPKPSSPVSCVLIVKNEERRIESCLERLRWAREVVVVDDESTDRTREICERWGACVIRQASNGNFDGQRNRGIEAAQGPWILQMDADEWVSEPLRREIAATVGKEHGPLAFRIKRNNYFLGQRMRHGGWAGAGGVKLFQKGKARYVGRSVHETIRVDGPTADLRCAIDHFPFDRIEPFVERQNFYTSVEARLWLEQNRSVSSAQVDRLLRGRPVKIFWKVYVRKRGFLDGQVGFLFALLYAWVEFLKWAKVWELRDETAA